MKSSSIINTVIQEISQQCLIQGLQVSDTLAAFMIRAVLLFPQNEFNIEDNITKQQMDKIIQLSVRRITDNSSPSVDTIRLQIYFDEHFVDFEEYTKQSSKDMDCRLKGLHEEIISSEADNCKSQECLYYKIAAFIIIKSCLGDYNNPAVIAETIGCLNSVLPISDIANFIGMRRKKKEVFLCELLMVVSGARLFNHEQRGGGGAGIVDVGSLMQTELPVTENNMLEQTNNVYRELDYLSKFLEFYRGTTRELPSKLQEHIKEALINACQRVLYLKIIKKQINISTQEVNRLMAKCKQDFENLNSELANNPALPSHQIYPQFASLGVARSILQMYHDYTKLLEHIWKSFKDFGQVNEVIMKSEELRKYVIMMAKGVVTPTKAALDLYRQGKIAKRIKVEGKDDLYIIYPERTSNFPRLSLQYRGFCSWTLVTRDRILVPGNTSLGLVCYRGLCYAFTSELAAQDFISDPMMYIRGVAELARTNPELIHLLRLYRDTASLLPYAQKSLEEMADLEKPILKTNSGSQTVTHPIPTLIDHSYEWNEWQLRRLAIKLTNLRTKKTHSTQTKMSTLRKDISTQVYTHKHTETQTKIDSYTNVPRPQVFLSGLRGANTKFETVDLTLRDDQDYEGDEGEGDVDMEKGTNGYSRMRSHEEYGEEEEEEEDEEEDGYDDDEYGEETEMAETTNDTKSEGTESVMVEESM